MNSLFARMTHGQGGSMVMTRFAETVLDAGAQAFLVDVDGNHELLCRRYRGTHLRLQPEGLPCLNPFNWVSADVTGEEIFWEEQGTLVQLLARMASPLAPLTNRELAWLAHATKIVCIEHGRKGSPHRVAEVLRTRCPGLESSIASVPLRLALQMLPFCEGGVHGSVFNGHSDLDLSAPLVIFEVGDLADDPALRGNVMACLIYAITFQMSVNRQVACKLALASDAWAWLDQGHNRAELVEECFQRAKGCDGHWVIGDDPGVLFRGEQP